MPLLQQLVWQMQQRQRLLGRTGWLRHLGA
jgi:hypothetical protein